MPVTIVVVVSLAKKGRKALHFNLFKSVGVRLIKL